jgi:hypothetical protein
LQKGTVATTASTTGSSTFVDAASSTFVDDGAT